MRRLRGHTGHPPGWAGRGKQTAGWSSDKRGPLICSRMAYRSGDQHAPVFDVDLPVVAVRQACGGSGLVLTGLLGPSALRRLWQGLPVLSRNGFLREENLPRVRAQLRNAMDRDPRGPLVLPLSFPARAVPSATPEHRHLYIDTVMSFRDSLRLARALGFVEAEHIARSRRLRQWQVRLAWRRPEQQVTAPRTGDMFEGRLPPPVRLRAPGSRLGLLPAGEPSPATVARAVPGG